MSDGRMSRIERLVSALQRFYGPLPSPPRDPFGQFVWEILSVRSTPRKRDAAFTALRRIRALTPDALWRAPQKRLEDSVALAGPYLEQRVSALRGGAERFRRAPGLAQAIRGPLAGARRALKTLPQFGAGGPQRMLLLAGGHALLPVDASIARVATRLGYAGDSGGAPASARTIRRALVGELPGDVEAFRRVFLYLSHHAVATCTEHDPHCPVCPLLEDCAYGLEETSGRGRWQTAPKRERSASS